MRFSQKVNSNNFPSTETHLLVKMRQILKTNRKSALFQKYLYLTCGEKFANAKELFHKHFIYSIFINESTEILENDSNKLPD